MYITYASFISVICERRFCRIVPGLLSQLMTFHKSEKSDAQLMPEGTTGRYWQMKLGKEWKLVAPGDAIGDAR